MGWVCSRGSHAEPNAALDPEVELWLVRNGGQRVRNGVEQPVVAADEAVSEVARLRAEVQAREDERLLAGPLPGVRESTHPREQALVEDLVDKKDPLPSAVKELAKEVSESDGGSTPAGLRKRQETDNARTPVTKLEVREPPPGAPVGTGLAEESPAMGGRPAREQAQVLEAAHAAEDARLEQWQAVDLEKHLAEK